MLVYDELLENFIDKKFSLRIIVKVLDDTLIYGYTHTSNVTELINVITSNGDVVYAIKNAIINNIFFDGKLGYYRLNIRDEYKRETILKLSIYKGTGGFPYSFRKNYEAIDSFSIFKNKQVVSSSNRKYPLGNVLSYTFGLEFETAAGYIPEDICFKDGLIPLRDGSISGLEYSTVVLSGKKGIALLRQQLATLRRYTIYDKECSLHIHLGGYPLDKDKIFALYKLCCSLYIDDLVPMYTFKTSKYKATGKDYCTKLPMFYTFEEMYHTFSGDLLEYNGSLTEKHPMDKTRERKWNIPYRYYWVNFINMLFFKVNKTIEFRFLRPSYNFEKIQLWLYILNAILKYADKNTDAILSDEFFIPSIEDILADVYDEELYNKLIDKLILLKAVVFDQSKVKDYWGGRSDIDDQYFGYNTVL